MTKESMDVGKISLNDLPIRGALSVTALLDIEQKYNELRLILDCGEEITHKTAVERLIIWRDEGM